MDWSSTVDCGINGIYIVTDHFAVCAFGLPHRQMLQVAYAHTKPKNEPKKAPTTTKKNKRRNENYDNKVSVVQTHTYTHTSAQQKTKWTWWTERDHKRMHRKELMLIQWEIFCDQVKTRYFISITFFLHFFSLCRCAYLWTYVVRTAARMGTWNRRGNCERYDFWSFDFNFNGRERQTKRNEFK